MPRHRVRTAPRWVVDLLGDSPARDIADRLIRDSNLAPTWDGLRSIPEFDFKRFLSMLPELIQFTRGDLPWDVRYSPREQQQQARRIAKLARQLNASLAAFIPLDPIRLHQFYPEAGSRGRLLLVSLAPVAGVIAEEPLLLRIATMADRFQPARAGKLSRPNSASAKERLFVRTFAPAIPDAASSGAALEFLAELVNAVLEPRTPWTSDRVRQSLRGLVRTHARASR